MMAVRALASDRVKAYRAVVVRVDERPLAVRRVPVAAQRRKAAIQRCIALRLLDLKPPPHCCPLLVLIDVPVLRAKQRNTANTMAYSQIHKPLRGGQLAERIT
jgi:hypothetical protein